MTRDLTSDCIAAAQGRGIAESAVRKQWERLQHGPSYCIPLGACQRNNGIHTLSEKAVAHHAERGNSLTADQAIRFVPASGAASRMFKALASGSREALDQLNARWEAFPFRSEAAASGPCDTAEERLEAVMVRLALPERPKGGLPFHAYPDGVRTAFEEHMREWRATFNGVAPPQVHFTLPEEGRPHWESLLQVWAVETGVVVSTSVQHPSTDTIAMGADGRPFMVDGKPLFRPGGHGALLHNLSELAHAHPGALVSIKNIDNVRPSTAYDEVIPWRQALLGLTDALNASRLAALAALRDGDMEPAHRWLEGGFSRSGEPRPASIDGLRHALDRPLLVAGMVRNEGEPGGGPFWLRDADGVLRAQIVESAEMDLADPRIGNCMDGATHFNPVDLVCALHDSNGAPYPLAAFVDGRRDFLVSKSHAGRALIGLEHPGLWNGAMGKWNTYFVEVPSRTFAPVKTVFDLLRPAHRT